MMSLPTRAVVTLTALAVGAGTALASAPAQAVATTVIQVRAADLVAPNDTSGGATKEFLAEGVHLKTPDASSYARAHFKVGLPLDQVHAVDYTWYGTSFQPSVYYDIDLDADGKPDGQLIGELTYGGKDVWLNRDTEDFGVTPTIPAGFFTSHSPCSPANAPQNGNVDGCGSSGDPAHGTLDDWVRSLKAAGKSPVLMSGGFLLNGAPGDGVLTQVTYGPNKYVFTSAAKSSVTVSLAAKHATVPKSRKERFSGHVNPVGTGSVVTLQEKLKGVWTKVKSRTVATTGAFKFGAKPAKTGTNRFRVIVGETNSTAAATSSVVKVKVTR
jgi:hypothetical protein